MRGDDTSIILISERRMITRAGRSLWPRGHLSIAETERRRIRRCVQAWKATANPVFCTSRRSSAYCL